MSEEKKANIEKELDAVENRFREFLRGSNLDNDDRKDFRDQMQRHLDELADLYDEINEAIKDKAKESTREKDEMEALLG